MQIQQEKTDILFAENQALLNLLDAQIEALEAKITQAIATDEQMSRRAEILRSIPGVGPVPCAVLIGEMPELGICNDRQIAALAGVASVDQQSGRKDAKRQIFVGRADVRAVLYQAALVASIHNSKLKNFANRLKKAGKPHKVVIIAVARKTITIANTLIAKNTLWSNS